VTGEVVLFKTADRYLFGQLLLVVVFGVVLFSIIWLAPETLFKLIQQISAGKITLQQGFVMFAYNIPAVLPQSIPMAALIGSLFLFRRLSINTEWTAMVCSGISPQRLMLPVVLMGLILVGFYTWVQEAVLPQTSPKLEKLNNTSGLGRDKRGQFVFVEKTNTGQLDKFILIGDTTPDVKTNNYRNLIVLFYRNDVTTNSVQIQRIVRASQAHWDGAQWQALNGVDYQLDTLGVYQQSAPFKHLAVKTSPLVEKLLSQSQAVPLDMSQRDLGRYVTLLQAGGQLQNLRFFQVRLSQKAALPLAGLVFIVLGALLGLAPARSNQNIGLTMGAAILFAYSVLMPLSSQLGSLGLLPVKLAAWLPLGVATILALGLLGLKQQLRA
jgi:lipopolysaccharide export system permease protein